MKALEALERAISLVTGRRAQDYGDAEASFQRIADGWNIIVQSADGDLTPAHVALMMDWVKSARLVENIDHEDSWVDKAGYSALGSEHIDRDKKDVPSLLLPRHKEIIQRMREKNAR